MVEKKKNLSKQFWVCCLKSTWEEEEEKEDAAATQSWLLFDDTEKFFSLVHINPMTQKIWK